MKTKIYRRLILLAPVVVLPLIANVSCVDSSNRYDITLSRDNNDALSDTNTEVTLTAKIFDVGAQVDVSDKLNVDWTCSQMLPTCIKCACNGNVLTLTLSLDKEITKQDFTFTAAYGRFSKFVKISVNNYIPPSFDNVIILDKNKISLTQTSKTSTITASVTGRDLSGIVTFNNTDLTNLPNYITSSISGNQLTLSLVSNNDTIQGNFVIHVSFTNAATLTFVVETENYESWPVECIPKDYLNISGSTLNGIKPSISKSELDSYTTLKIPKQITRIKEWAFAWDASYGSFNSYLSNNNTILDWGESQITEIGKYAFTIAPFQGGLTFPNTLTTLSEGSFGACAGLTSLDVSNTKLTFIPRDGFMGCNSLTSITFVNSIKTIQNSAFLGCKKISGVISLPTELTTIQPGAFSEVGQNSSGYTLNWNSKITQIGGSCFAFSKLTGVLTLPNTIRSIPQAAFCNTQITKATIHSNITSVGDIIFSECKQLNELVIKSTSHFQYSANPGNPASTSTLLYKTPIDPDGTNPSQAGAKVIVPASELSWYKANWPARLTIVDTP